MTVYLFILLGVWSFMVLAAKFLPDRSRPVLKGVALDQLYRQMRPFRIVTMVGLFAAIPLLAWLLMTLMQTVKQAYIGPGGEGEIVLGMNPWIFFVPALFMSMIIYGLVFDYLGTFVGAAMAGGVTRFRSFMYQWNKQMAWGMAIDTKKAFVFLTIFVMPVFLVMFVLGVNYYSKISDKGLVFSNYLELKQRNYDYGQIIKILHLSSFRNKQSGQIESTRPYYVLVMEDGARWTTLSLGISQTEEERELAELIAARAQLPIVEGVHNIDDIWDEAWLSRRQVIDLLTSQPEVKNYQEMLAAAGSKAIFSASDDGEVWLVQVYEIVGEEGLSHTATFNWYRVDKKTGQISRELEP